MVPWFCWLPIQDERMDHSGTGFCLQMLMDTLPQQIVKLRFLLKIYELKMNMNATVSILLINISPQRLKIHISAPKMNEIVLISTFQE